MFNWQKEIDIKELRTYNTEDFIDPKDSTKRIKIVGGGLLHAFVNKEFKRIEELPCKFPEGKELDNTNYVMNLPSWGKSKLENNGKVVKIYDEKETPIYRFHSPAVLNTTKNKSEASFNDFDECRFEIKSNKLYFKLPNILKNKIPLKAYDDIDTTSTNNMDTYIDEHFPTTNDGTGTQISVMWNSPSVYRIRSIMDWTLPVGTGVITQIVLYCYSSLKLGTSIIDLHQLSADFIETEATWNIRKAATSWINPGGDYNATVIDETAGAAVDAWQAWYILGGTSDNPLTTLTWGDNLKLLLKQKQETSSSKANNYYSKEYSVDTAKRPYIEITYTPSTSGWAGKILGVTNPGRIIGINTTNISKVVGI